MSKKRYFNKKRKYEDVFSKNKFDGDIVFSRFINYMQIALYHKKLDYDKHQEFLKSQEELEYRGWSVLSDGDSEDYSLFNLNEDYNKLDIAISKLTDKQRYVIVNYYFKHKSLSKIAKKLNTNVDAVNHLKFRAILSLRRFLED